MQMALEIITVLLLGQSITFRLKISQKQNIKSKGEILLQIQAKRELDTGKYY
jgi:ABC-type branched-subunit amino acid transport system ATPase component